MLSRRLHERIQVFGTSVPVGHFTEPPVELEFHGVKAVSAIVAREWQVTAGIGVDRFSRPPVKANRCLRLKGDEQFLQATAPVAAELIAAGRLALAEMAKHPNP